MDCPHCAATMADVTETWHTFAEAQGAEYLAEYVSIWHCPACGTLTGENDSEVEWVMLPDDMPAREDSGAVSVE